MFGGDRGVCVHVLGIAEDFDRDDRFGSRRDGGLKLGWVHVEALWIDINKDGRRADEENAVGRGDE